MAVFLVQFLARQLRISKICFDFTWKVILITLYHESISVIFDKFFLQNRSDASLRVRLDSTINQPLDLHLTQQLWGKVWNFSCRVKVKTRKLISVGQRGGTVYQHASVLLLRPMRSLCNVRQVKAYNGDHFLTSTQLPSLRLISESKRFLPNLVLEFILQVFLGEFNFIPISSVWRLLYMEHKLGLHGFQMAYRKSFVYDVIYTQFSSGSFVFLWMCNEI
jgi:hypothetical protein